MQHAIVKKVELPCRNASLASIVRNILFVFAHRDIEGINHITGDVHYCALALIGCRTVLTIHDTSACDHQSRPIKKTIARWLWFKLPLIWIDEVVCISNHTRSKVNEISRRSALHVIHNPIDRSIYCPRPSKNNDLPILLQVGTSWNKNLPNIIRAIAGLRCHLRIIGVPREQERALLNHACISYSHNENLTETEIIKAYENADLVLFCSLYEGFGMPIIEAGALERCVITSSIEPMVEVGGGGARYVDPRDIESIRSAIVELLDNPDLRQSLARAGSLNADRFRVDLCLEKYLRIYRKINFH
jgi:glycosyltransferase involved in cell wall biosynthesis